MTPAAIFSKLRNYCNVLRDDLSACGPACHAAAQARHAQAGGMSCLLARCAQASGDYVEQLTALTLALSQRERG